MPTLQIKLHDVLKSRLARRAAESGFASVEDYVQSLVRADVEGQVVSDDELEKLLLRRLRTGPGVDLTPAFVNRFKRDVADRRRRNGKRR